MSNVTCTIDEVEPSSAAPAEIGRTKAIIVFANGGDPKATVTPIIARAVPATPSEIRFGGVVAVEENDVVVHANEVVLPLVDRICTLLGVQNTAITVEMVNVGVASSGDRAVKVSGLSAELPLFLATLSARLLLPIPQDVVSTGHIGSSDGDIRLVRNMPAKLRAAVNDHTVTRFVCPSIHADTSMQMIKAGEAEQIKAAMSLADQRLHVLEVEDVVDAIQVVFDEKAIALASLRAGFFGAVPVGDSTTGSAAAAAHYLCQDGRRRFLNALQSRYLLADAPGAREALELWAAMHRMRDAYPRGFGQDMLILLASLPPHVRQAALHEGGLVPMSLSKALTELASDGDEEDLNLLYRAAAGTWSAIEAEKTEDEEQDGPIEASAVGRVVQSLISAMDAERLARAIGTPIDAARESFMLGSVLARTNRVFMDTVASFYLHLQRSTGRAGGAASVEDAAPEALQLIERAFGRAGGLQGARAEAKAGTQGGCRYVLDQMVQQYKLEKKHAHLTALFAEALDPMEWESKVAVITAFLRLYRHILPPDLRSEPPERFATKYQDLVRAYVQFLDGFRQVARTM